MARWNASLHASEQYLGAVVACRDFFLTRTGFPQSLAHSSATTFDDSLALPSFVDGVFMAYRCAAFPLELSGAPLRLAQAASKAKSQACASLVCLSTLARSSVDEQIFSVSAAQNRSRYCLYRSSAAADPASSFARQGIHPVKATGEQQTAAPSVRHRSGAK